VMAWVALDRAIKSVERHGLEGPLPRWKACRQRIFESVCSEGYDARRNTFVQHYGSSELDASLLMLPLVGFLPAQDPRMVGTVKAIEQELLHDGFVLRRNGSAITWIRSATLNSRLPAKTTSWIRSCDVIRSLCRRR